MSEPLRNVKKEIRILGLDVCNPRVAIGAVVRGGLYLDGILAFPHKTNSVELAKEIAKTKYFPELRVIMIHDPKSRLNLRTIRRITALPVVQFPHGTKTRPGLRETAESGQEGEGTMLHPSTLRKIVKLTQTRGDVPEPIRIAHLLSKLRIVERL